jgi:predicted ATPase
MIGGASWARGAVRVLRRSRLHGRPSVNTSVVVRSYPNCRKNFDSGLIDAAAALQHLTSEPALATLEEAHCYHKRVFITPPWPEIYVEDPERRHGFDDAVAEYERLVEVYPSLGYDIVMLPKAETAERADFVMRTLKP